MNEELLRAYEKEMKLLTFEEEKSDAKTKIGNFFANVSRKLLKKNDDTIMWHMSLSKLAKKVWDITSYSRKKS